MQGFGDIKRRYFGSDFGRQARDNGESLEQEKKENLSNTYRPYYTNKYYLPQRIGPGALGNDQVKKCFTCRNNGFINESITFKKRPDGSWLLVDYYSGQPHEHRQRKESEVNEFFNG
ncbi:MAG: hypothetical protein GEU26_05495 [Nitrososphaeraceae archaeon]|nr:hypothetical protein [Nitrososphaeraceae archaeon]